MGKLTDNEIIKALECCINAECQICPLYDNDAIAENCPTGLLKLCANLINRQKAEIERLRHEYSNAVLTIESKNSYIEYLHHYAKERKIEEIENRGIKKFARRLKAEVAHIPAWGSVAVKKIDNLVKEMTENITKIEHNSLCETETYKGGV